jgi:hypothetical protein
MFNKCHASISRLFGLRSYVAAAATVAVGVSILAFTKANQKPHFQEIDAERINIVEPDGTLRMVISGRDRSQGPMFKGKPFGYPGGTRAGIIFFNDEGTEDGGLTWNGKTVNGKHSAGAQLSFDQYNQDQIVTLQYADENGVRQQGLRIEDRANIPINELVDRIAAIRKMPNGPAKDSAMNKLVDNNGDPIAAQRVFVGRDRSKTAVVNLSDALGKPRLRLMVDSAGAAKIEFLDTHGKVTRSISGDDGSK